MATGIFSANSTWVALGVLLCLVGGGRARSLNEDAQFICPNTPKGTTQSKPCDGGEIGEAYATEAFGNPLRKLLTRYYVRRSSSPYGRRSSRYGNSSPYGSSRYGSSPYQGSSGPSSTYNDPFLGGYGGSPFGRGSTQNGASSGGYPSGGGGGAGCSDTDSSVQAVIACTNAVRQNPEAFRYPCSTPWLREYTSQRRGPLGINGALMNAAQGHSNYQARTGRMTHSGPGGNSVGSRVRQAGYNWRGVAENVAMGQRSAKQVVLDWMCSPGHRRNMMSCRYSDMGIGVTCSGRCFYTQDFGCDGSCGCSGGAPSSGGSPFGGSQFGGSGFGSNSGYDQRTSPSSSRYSTSTGWPFGHRSMHQPQQEQPHWSTSTRNPFEQSTQSPSNTPWWASETSGGRPSFFSRSKDGPSPSKTVTAFDSSRSSPSDSSWLNSRLADFFAFAR